MLVSESLDPGPILLWWTHSSLNHTKVHQSYRCQNFPSSILTYPRIPFTSTVRISKFGSNLHLILHPSLYLVTIPRYPINCGLAPLEKQDPFGVTYSWEAPIINADRTYACLVFSRYSPFGTCFIFTWHWKATQGKRDRCWDVDFLPMNMGNSAYENYHFRLWKEIQKRK